MTSRPPRVRRPSPGGRRAARPAPWSRARVVQVLSTVTVGALTVGLLVHDTTAPSVPSGSVVADSPGDPVPQAGASSTGSAERSGSSEGSEPTEPTEPTRSAERTGPGATADTAVPRVTGPADRTGDLLAGPPRLPEVAPSAPLRLPEPPAVVGLDLGRLSTTDPASTWVVVNKALPLAPADFAPTDLVVVGGYEVRAALQDPLTRMLAAAAADGVRLELRSGFRSAAYQQQVHADWASRVGAARVDEVSARPGHSEHQTGLAVDVGSGSRPACDFQACFDVTPEGAWVAARAAEFGFVVRYTAANQAVTGYAPEGWHLRYVGTDLVAEMRRRGVTTLEELFGVPGGPDYR